MTTAYPGGLDAFTNPTGVSNLNDAPVLHSAAHANLNDAVEALEAELGLLPKGGSASVRARLDALDTTVAAKALASRTISAGTGLTGGGDLSANRTLTVDLEYLQDQVAAMLTPGTNVTLSYNDTTGALTINATGGGSSGAAFGYQKLAASTAVRMYDANRVDTNAYNTLSQLTFAPFYMAYGSNLLRHFYVNVGTTAATSVIRLGVYAAGSDGLPGALVVDLGTVSGSAATGDVILSRGAGSEITLAPGLYFLAAAIQTAACTVARYVSSYTAYGTGIYGEAASTTSGATNNATIPYQNGVTGALPGTATISGVSNTGIFVAARVQ